MWLWQDAGKSTGATTGQLTYQWSYATGTAASGLSATGGVRVTYAPPSAGILGVTLSVRNGACPESRVTLNIEARCLSLLPQLREPQGQGYGASMSYSVQFDGTKFPRVELDASQSVRAPRACAPTHAHAVHHTLVSPHTHTPYTTHL